jgi:enterochelin esterase-like enzyme
MFMFTRTPIKLVIAVGLFCLSWVPCNAQNCFEINRENRDVTIQFKGNYDSVTVFSSLAGFKTLKQEGELWRFLYTCDNCDRFILDYYFSGYNEGIREKVKSGYYAGGSVPTLAPMKRRVKGNVTDVTLHSAELGEDRVLTVYEPPRFKSKKTYPLLYCADGEQLGSFIKVVDNAIRDKLIPPLIVAGIHNKRDSTKPTSYFRNLEYLIDYNIDFAVERESIAQSVLDSMNGRHGNFFAFISNAVLPWIKDHYNISEKYCENIAFGVSNGADFAVNYSLNQSKAFGSVIALSNGWPLSYNSQPSDTSAVPTYYLAVGTKEEGFYQNANGLKKFLERSNIPVTYQEFETGHNVHMWSIELLNYLKQILN